MLVRHVQRGSLRTSHTKLSLAPTLAIHLILFFRQQSNPQTGSYHGLSPTGRQSCSYGLLHFTTDKAGKVTDVTIWRAGFAEEREVLVS